MLKRLNTTSGEVSKVRVSPTSLCGQWIRERVYTFQPPCLDSCHSGSSDPPIEGDRPCPLVAPPSPSLQPWCPSARSPPAGPTRPAVGEAIDLGARGPCASPGGGILAPRRADEGGDLGVPGGRAGSHDLRGAG